MNPKWTYWKQDLLQVVGTSWGKTKKKDTPTDLRVVTLFQYTPSECPVRDPSQFCAGKNVPGIGGCSGDSGGNMRSFFNPKHKKA